MDAGTLAVKTTLDLSGFKTGLDKAEGLFKSFGNTAEQQIAKLGKGSKFDIDTTPAENKFKALGGTIAKVGLTTAIAGTTTAVVGLGAALGKSISSAADFEKTLSGIKAVSGATDAQMQALSKTALRIGKDTTFSASEAADAMGELVKAGVSLEDVMNGAADAAVSLAAAGGVSIPEAATLASNAMNTFHIAAKDMAGVVDTIAGVANASAIDVKDFGFSLQSVGAVANTIGLTFNDTAAAIGLLGNAGIKGSDAGTSLKTMFMGLQPQTKKQTALFKELGLMTEDGANQFFDASGKIKSLAEISGLLQTALKDQTQQQRLATLETIFGTDAVRAAAVLYDNGAEGVDKFAKAMTGISAADVAKTRMDNLQGSLEAFKGSMETLAITVGMALLPVLKQMVDGAVELLNALTPLAEKVGPMIADAFTQIGAAVGPFVEKLVPQLLAFFQSGDAGAFAEDLQTRLAPIIEKLGPLFDALGSAVRATLVWFQTDGRPIIQALGDGLMRVATEIIPPFIEAFTDLLNQVQPTLQAISQFWHRWGDDIMNYTGRIWNLISDQIKTVLSIIKNAIELVMNVIQGDWSGAWDNVKAILGGVLNLILNEIKAVADLWRDAFGAFFGWLLDKAKTGMAAVFDALKEKWDAITQKFTDAGNGIKTFVSDTWTAIKTTISDLWTSTTDLLGQKWDAIKQKFLDAKQTIQDAITGPFEGAKAALGGIMDGITSAITKPWNTAANSINGFIKGFASAVDWISGKLGAGALIGTPQLIPTFAKGGTAPGGPIIAGENGPELLVPPKGTQIIPAGKTQQILNNPALMAKLPPDVAMAAFRWMYGTDPQGAPIGTKGVGAGIFDAIGAGAEKLKNLTGAAMDTVSSFVKAGVEAAVSAGFAKFGVSAPLAGSFLAPVGTAIFGTMKDALIGGLKGIWKKVEDSLGDSDVIDMALKTPGEYMWCEKFVGDVMARLGRRYFRAASAEAHSTMQPLNPGLGPKGAIVFFPWQDVGHVAFSGGNGQYFGTVPGGTGWSSGMSPKGWTTNPRWRGGPINEPVFGVGLRSGESYSFGERGPEWVTPLSGARGAGGVNVTLQQGAVQVNAAPGQNEEDIARRVVDKLSAVFMVAGREAGLSM